MKDSNKAKIKSDSEVGDECKVENNIRFYSEYAKHIYLAPSARPAKAIRDVPTTHPSHISCIMNFIVYSSSSPPDPVRHTSLEMYYPANLSRLHSLPCYHRILVNIIYYANHCSIYVRRESGRKLVCHAI